MNRDISDILTDWLFDPQDAVRKIVGDDGREKVQMRVRIGTYHGVLQFDCDGRADGARPHGGDFALDYYARDLEETGEDAFTLNHAQCEELFEESSMTYERYVILLQLGDWDRVIRDTVRNMRLFRFINRYAEKEPDRRRLERWWPYILRIHHIACAQKKLEAGNLEEALEEINEAMLRIGSIGKMEDAVHETERARSLQALGQLRDELVARRPQGELERLEREKERAVEAQDYERAAVLRDRIGRLRQNERRSN